MIVLDHLKPGSTGSSSDIVQVGAGCLIGRLGRPPYDRGPPTRPLGDRVAVLGEAALGVPYDREIGWPSGPQWRPGDRPVVLIASSRMMARFLMSLQDFWIRGSDSLYHKCYTTL